MKVKWYAHACLRIEGDGVSIITDPYTPQKSGFTPVTETAVVVVRSSDDDSAHANAAMIPGDPEVVTATHILHCEGEMLALPAMVRLDGKDIPLSLTRAGIRFAAIPAMESMLVKLVPRDNAMYCFEVEGIRIVSFRRCGQSLEPWQLAQMGEVDVAIVPTGGPPTIELTDLHDALGVLRPAVTIPMHYELPGCKFPTMADVREFTQRYPRECVRWADTPEIELEKSSLPAEPEVWVLQATTAG